MKGIRNVTSLFPIGINKLATATIIAASYKLSQFHTNSDQTFSMSTLSVKCKDVIFL